MTKNKTMNRILTEKEIREIQKEEIHKFIIKYIWAAVWVVMYLVCNWVAFQFIADAIKENIIELLFLGTVFNFMVQVGFYQVITATLKDGE